MKTIAQATKRWSMPIRDWKPVLNQFMILYREATKDFLKAVYEEIFTALCGQ